MKYVLLFADDEESHAAWEGMTEAERDAARGRIMRWFETNGDVMRGGEELQPPSTATTIRRYRDGSTVVSDGPFIEGKEVIGGFAVVEVPDLDAAITLVRSWPSPGRVEIRPVTGMEA